MHFSFEKGCFCRPYCKISIVKQQEKYGFVQKKILCGKIRRVFKKTMISVLRHTVHVIQRMYAYVQSILPVLCMPNRN